MMGNVNINVTKAHADTDITLMPSHEIKVAIVAMLA